MSLPKQPLTHPGTVYGVSSFVEELPFSEPLSLTQTQLLCNTMGEVKRSLELPFGSSLGFVPMNEIIGIHLAHAWMKAKLMIRQHSFSEKTATGFMTAVERLIDQKIEAIFAKRQQYIFQYQGQTGAAPELSVASQSQAKTVLHQMTALMDIPAPQFHQSYRQLIENYRSKFLKASSDLNYLTPGDIPSADPDHIRLTAPPSGKLFECLMDHLADDWNRFIHRLAPADAAYYIILRN